MLQTIKKIAVEAVNSGSPLRLIEARVVSTSPLNIRLRNEQKLIIPEDIIIVPEHLRRHTRRVRLDGISRTLEFVDGLSTGDRVMVAVVQGGQSFFIIDRI